MTERELLPRNETVTESKSKVPSLQNSVDGLFLQNGKTPTFPYAPPNVDDMPALKQINAPVWPHTRSTWSLRVMNRQISMHEGTRPCN